jgi:hypothetical protein
LSHYPKTADCFPICRFEFLISFTAFCRSLSSATVSRQFQRAVLPGRHRAEAGKIGAEKSDPGNAADGEIKVAARRQTAGLKWFAAFCRNAATKYFSEMKIDRLQNVP